MFGARIDYWLLRPWADKRKMRTEEELDAQAPKTLDVEQATARLQKWNARLDNRIPIDNELHYLDVGCGKGDLTIAFALAGCKHVTGIDMMPRYIRQAQAASAQLQLENCVHFACSDIHDWDTPCDVVLSHEMLEHVSRPDSFLRKMRELVSPRGAAVIAFGPLFHSPFGDHMHFLRVRIPWKSLLFSEQAIMRLRREFYRPTDPATRFEEIRGGLNKMRYSEFLNYVQEAGWRVEQLSVNPQLRRFPPLYWISNLLTRIPWLKDYCAASVYAILRP